MNVSDEVRRHVDPLERPAVPKRHGGNSVKPLLSSRLGFCNRPTLDGEGANQLRSIYCTVRSAPPRLSLKIVERPQLGVYCNGRRYSWYRPYRTLELGSPKPAPDIGGLWDGSTIRDQTRVERQSQLSRLARRRLLSRDRG